MIELAEEKLSLESFRSSFFSVAASTLRFSFLFLSLCSMATFVNNFSMEINEIILGLNLFGLLAFNSEMALKWFITKFGKAGISSPSICMYDKIFIQVYVPFNIIKILTITGQPIRQSKPSFPLYKYSLVANVYALKDKKRLSRFCKNSLRVCGATHKKNEKKIRGQKKMVYTHKIDFYKKNKLLTKKRFSTYYNILHKNCFTT
jgi:hypothetical protein